jgi:hypothetical protein
LPCEIALVFDPAGVTASWAKTAVDIIKIKLIKINNLFISSPPNCYTVKYNTLPGDFASFFPVSI